MSRSAIGEGGWLNKALSFASQEAARLGWSFDPRKAVSDSRGIYAWTVDLASPTGQDFRTVLTARQKEPPHFWSVTGDLEEIAVRWDAWLVGYWAIPLATARVWDPNRYDHTEGPFPGRGKTYEFVKDEGAILSNWLSSPPRRVLQRRL